MRISDWSSDVCSSDLLFEALGGMDSSNGIAAVPAFGHLSLIAGAGGEALSKRLGSLSLAGLRASGLEAMTINCTLARLGTPDPIEPLPDLAALAPGFDIPRFGRASPKFRPAALGQIGRASGRARVGQVR